MMNSLLWTAVQGQANFKESEFSTVTRFVMLGEKNIYVDNQEKHIYIVNVYC